jgi:hypothetical protein
MQGQLDPIQLMQKIGELESKIDALRTIEVGKPFYEDLRFPATPGLINPVTSKPDYDYTNIGYLFDPASAEYIYLIAQMPHDWVAGSTIYPHFHWMPTSTNTGNVYWVMVYKWTNIDATDASSNSNISAIAPADGTAYKHQLTDLSTIAGTGKTSSSILSIILYRYANHVNDTYTGDALLKEFDIHYLKDPSKSYWAGSVP